ncbi:MAG: hypothetical protein JSV97_07755 [candidate division WOR-3 bacterium]|nr:MAG: hypothetical protein JSV97_07755 [candidate division WOR-3 bacterium]
MHKMVSIVLLSTIGFAAEVVTFDDNWGEHSLFNVVSERPRSLEIVFSMHTMVIDEQTIDGVVMRSFGVPAVFLPYPGVPNLTGASRYVAVPQGATAQVKILDTRIEVYRGVEVAPAPNIPRNNDDSPLRYEKNMSIYGRDVYYPSSPVTLSQPMKMRGVDVVLVGVIPFQYNPITKELIVYKDIRFTIDYVGGNGHFGDDQLRSRFWESMLQGHLLNYNSLPEIDFYAPERLGGRDGYEYIIIVPDDPVFEAWGDTIKAWRKLQGISCEVYTLTEVGGNTTTAIENFLNNAYATWDPRPVAFLLLSDYQSSGDVYGITSPVWNSYCVSDNIYADVNGDDLPDMHHGRICAQDESDLSIMINKFLSYERNPYTDADFYRAPLCACGWQDDRWFQLASEVVRGFLINELSRSPARQYNLGSPANPVAGGPWSTRTGTTPVVAYWNSYGYIPLNNPYGSSWWNNGSAAGVNAAINAGAFIVQHRDHGSETGWGEPSYHIGDLDGLTNTMFTWVNSTNCLTGKYNSLSETFSEKFHRIEYGALGLNAASEVSYSFVNDTYIWGMWDCYWSDFDPGYPGMRMTGHDNLRPCQAMTYGKYYLEAMWFPDSVPGVSGLRVYTYHLFHHHTDAFVTLYSQIPESLSVSHNSELAAGQTSFAVTANDSSVIALTVDGEIIGVAEGTGSPLDISIPAQDPLDTMIVTVTKANYYRYVAKVPVTDVGLPGTPTVTRPLDFARLPDLQPTLNFYSTDPQDDNLQYRVLWDTDPSFGSCDSSTTSLYASGAVVDFAFPSPLVDGETYWWKVKCTDPAGSGYWTAYTSKRSFTVSTTLPSGICSWFQTTADQFNCNTFDCVVVQGDSVILGPSGQTVVDTILEEHFEAVGMPAGWTVIDGNDDAIQWTVGTIGALGPYTPPSYGTRYAYYSDDDAGNGVVNYNEELISPRVYVGNVTSSLELMYGYGFQIYESGEKYRVNMRKKTDGSWSGWTTLKTYTANGSGSETIDLTSYLPADSMQFEWFYSDSTAASHWGYACACDNVILRYSYDVMADEGTMTSTAISYHDLSTTYPRTHWGDVMWHKSSAGDSIGIQVEYYNGATWQLIPDGDLPGNATGFYTSLATDSIVLQTLDTLTYHTLRLIGLFYRRSTEAPDDPVLLDWEIGNSTNYIGVEEWVKDVLSPMLKVYPSITRSQLNICFTFGNPEADVTLRIYDAAGRLVKSFNQLANTQSLINRVIWNGRDDIGRAVPAGIYFVFFETGDYKKVEKAIFIR